MKLVVAFRSFSNAPKTKVASCRASDSGFHHVTGTYISSVSCGREMAPQASYIAVNQLRLQAFEKPDQKSKVIVGSDIVFSVTVFALVVIHGQSLGKCMYRV
jgi:hypothetical protein